MGRRCLAFLLATTVTLGLSGTLASLPAHADDTVRISNISLWSVAANGDGTYHVKYRVCAEASSLPFANYSGMNIQSSGGTTYNAHFQQIGTCGNLNGTAYLLETEDFPPIPAGSYQFVGAGVVANDNTPSNVFRNSSFAPGSSAGVTIAGECVVDFNTSNPPAPADCNDPQQLNVQGSIFGGSPPPSTNTPTPSPTNTPVPSATNTPVPSATNTPVQPTATAPDNGGGGTPPANTPTTPSGGGHDGQGNPSPTDTPQVVFVVVTNTPTSGGSSSASSSSTSTSVGSSNNADNSSSTSNNSSTAPTSTAVSYLVGSSNGDGSQSGSSSSQQSDSSKQGNQGSQPASTPVSINGSSPTTGSGTHQGQKAAAGKTAAGSALEVTLRDPVVRPGDAEHLAISYVEDALVQARVAFAGRQPASFYGMTDAHGHLTMAIPVPKNVPLQNGHTTAKVTVYAVAGTRSRVTTAARAVRPGTIASISIAARPNTLAHALVTLPGQHPLAVVNATDSHGRLRLTIKVPRKLPLRRGHAMAHVAVWSIVAKRHAQTSSTLNISDMVVSVTESAIKNCVQTQAVHVSYRPHAPLRVVLTFPGRHALTLKARADGHGNATAQARLSYVQATSPLAIGVQVVDATPRVHRSESFGFKVPLPAACQKVQPASITISG